MTVCPECGSDVRWNFYRHLVSVHSYSTDDIERLKNEIKEEKVKSKTATQAKCEECGKIFSSENSLRAHRSREHHDSSAVVHRMKCPLCLVVVKNHHALVEHANCEHATDSEAYTVRTITFDNRHDYEEWRVKEEEIHVLRWVTNTARACGDKRITYFRCSRALKNPMYTKANTKKVAAYCTAFMKRSAIKKKASGKENVGPASSYDKDELNACMICFRRDPEKPSDFTTTHWLKCNRCGIWVHEDCIQGENVLCPFDDGDFIPSTSSDHEDETS